MPEPRSIKAMPASPSTVLVVDDEHLVATGLVNDLKELGFDPVGPASDGDEAIEICRSTMPDMAILDICMPKRNGIEAAECMYQTLNVPVILCTAFASPEYVESGKRAGIFGYLLKPVTKDQLRVTLEVAWERYLSDLSKSEEIDKLKQRLEDRKIIEQAKWVIVERKSIPEPEAMRLLQKQARNNRRTLVEVARSVIEHEPLL